MDDYYFLKQRILKWPGGKAWIAPTLKSVFENEINDSGIYYEPFLGSGAVFFSLKHKHSLLSDINVDLITFYKTLRKNYKTILKRVHKYSNTSKCFYKTRNSKPRTKINQAVRFLYLNRTCWGGIYRINKNGDFNVPFGNSGRSILDQKIIELGAKALKKAKLKCCDFELTISKAKKGDVIYADPPYNIKGNKDLFLRYNENVFGWTDQERLAIACHKASKRGAFIAISMAWHHDFTKLYPNWWILKIHRKSLVSRKVKGRKSVCEVVLFNRKPHFLDGNVFNKNELFKIQK